MVTGERNRNLYQIHLRNPELTYQDLAEMVHLSRQRVEQIIRQQEKVEAMGPLPAIPKFPRLNGDPISPAQVSRTLGLPAGLIQCWVRRKQVKVLHRPKGHPGPGKVTLLDPVSLQERLDRYRPRRKLQQVQERTS